MTNFVIHKSSRAPSNQTYVGPTWDTAGIRNKWQSFYENHGEACKLARELSIFNPVGFTVSEIKEINNE